MILQSHTLFCFEQQHYRNQLSGRFILFSKTYCFRPQPLKLVFAKKIKSMNKPKPVSRREWRPYNVYGRLRIIHRLVGTGDWWGLGCNDRDRNDFVPKRAKTVKTWEQNDLVTLNDTILLLWSVIYLLDGLNNFVLYVLIEFLFIYFKQLKASSKGSEPFDLGLY